MRIIGGSARGKKLLSPADPSVRPALDRTRESIFGILQDRFEDADVLDLFAGVGAFGLEALSRGARHVTFVEQSPDTLSTLEKNIRILSFQRQTTCLCGDALAVPDLDAEEHPFGVVFMDPPFAMVNDPPGAERIFSRLADLLRSRATGEETVAVLRLPSSYAETLPFPSHDERVFGQSRVALFTRSSAERGL